LLDGLNCIGNAACDLGDFTPTTACDYKPDSMKCDVTGRLAYMYIGLDCVKLSVWNNFGVFASYVKKGNFGGTIASNLATFSALTQLYANHQSNTLYPLFKNDSQQQFAGCHELYIHIAAIACQLVTFV
jgi:hypothetical protein